MNFSKLFCVRRANMQLTNQKNAYNLHFIRETEAHIKIQANAVPILEKYIWTKDVK